MSYRKKYLDSLELEDRIIYLQAENLVNNRSYYDLEFWLDAVISLIEIHGINEISLKSFDIDDEGQNGKHIYIIKKMIKSMEQLGYNSNVNYMKKLIIFEKRTIKK